MSAYLLTAAVSAGVSVIVSFGFAIILGERIQRVADAAVRMGQRLDTRKADK